MYLNCHSYYSLRHGVLSIDQLIWQAEQLQVKALAITETNCTTSMLDFYKACKARDIKPLIGIDFRDNDHQQLYIGIAKNEEGIHELNSIISDSNLNQVALNEYAPECSNCFFIYPFPKSPKQLKPNEYIGIHYSDLPKLRHQQIDPDKLVVHQAVTFLEQQTADLAKQQTGIDLKELHLLLRSIASNSLISKLPAHQKPKKDEQFLPIKELEECFKHYPQILRNTQQLIDQCDVKIDFEHKKNKAHFISQLQDTEQLDKLTWQGFEKRYDSNDQKAIDRINNELKVIKKLRFTSYFLITWDIIRYSKSKGFYHVGRGSGANSVVAYCLGITDVDPIELNLYFERFINASRTSPPDFDIDFSWKDRDTIYNYIFSKYSNGHIALLGTISEFKHKSIIRELSKVFGLYKEETNNIIFKSDQATDPLSLKILHYSKYVQKHHFPNQRSIHAGGVLISEKPITYYSALELPPKGYPTVQFDMYIAEAIGLDKLDILSQRGIGHINDSIQIIKENKGLDIDIHQIEQFKQDKKLNSMLKTGNTIGCFYIESSAMRALIQKIGCEDYITLVAASSIIRPGVAKSGMMRAYIERYHSPDNVPYPHPIFKEHLSETYGIMVYQEDVIKICHHFAGFTLEDADVIRRAMSGKYRSKAAFQTIVEQYFANCKARGYSEALTNDIWNQISSFASYSFAKGHSASYAVESYQSLFLKTYYPLEFMVGVINNFGGFYSTATYVHEAKRLGANVKLPCINESQYLTRITGIDIYLGFIHIERLEYKLAKAIIRERYINGPYHSLDDFMQRIHIGIEQVVLLIRIGAFSFSGKSKKTLLWEVHVLWHTHQKIDYQASSLFKTEAKQYQYPNIEDTPIENALDELELLGFTISSSYFDLLKTSHRGDVYADDLIQYVGKEVRIMGKLAHIKNVPTSNGKKMSFGTFMDDRNTLFDTVNFPPSLVHYPFQGTGIYLIMGIVTEDFNHPTIKVEKMAKLPLLDDPRYADSSRLRPGKPVSTSYY